MIGYRPLNDHTARAVGSRNPVDKIDARVLLSLLGEHNLRAHRRRQRRAQLVLATMLLGSMAVGAGMLLGLAWLALLAVRWWLS